MMTRHWMLFPSIAAIVFAASLTGCSLFKETEKTVEHAEKTMEHVEKVTVKVEQKVEKAGKEKSPEETHQGPLVDNKVTALRVQEALKREGAEFQHVVVDGTKAEVVLTGTVGSAKARERAAEIAKKIEPRIKLKNELRVAK